MKALSLTIAALFVGTSAMAGGLQAQGCNEGQELLNVNMSVPGKIGGTLVNCILDEAKKCSTIYIYTDIKLPVGLGQEDDLQGAGRRALAVKADLQEQMESSVQGAPAMGLCVENDTVVDMTVSGPQR